MKFKKDNHSSDFINFGTFSAEVVAILKLEFEKRGIPVKIIYPGTGIGSEVTAQAGWSAYKILIRGIDVKIALEICNSLNIEAEHKIYLPKLLYTNINRYIFSTIFGIWLVFLILEILGALQDDIFIFISTSLYFLAILLFITTTTYKIIKRNRK